MASHGIEPYRMAWHRIASQLFVRAKLSSAERAASSKAAKAAAKEAGVRDAAALLDALEVFLCCSVVH